MCLKYPFTDYSHITYSYKILVNTKRVICDYAVMLFLRGNLFRIKIQTFNNIFLNSMAILPFESGNVISLVKNSGINSGKLNMAIQSLENQHCKKKRTSSLAIHMWYSF